MKVAVLLGGVSKERDVSLRSGQAVCDALSRKGHEVIRVDVTGVGVVDELRSIQPEAVFLALHGRFGEDGTMQSLLEWLHLPYTGSSVLSSSLCFDKLATKLFVGPQGILTPDFHVFTGGEDVGEWAASQTWTYPLIVKPNTEGSTIGINRVYKEEELVPAITEALKFDQVVLIESLISGREMTVSVVDGRPLPIVEIVPKSGFYDYQSKYTKGSTEYLVPAPLTPDQTKSMQAAAAKSYALLGCEGAARADFILDAQGKAWFLEINTLPGMTETSLLPKSAAAEGIPFDDLCELILKGARLKIPGTKP